MSARRPALLGPRRRLAQWVASVALLAIPFVRIGGESLLRLDLPSRTLFLGGGTLGIEELYLLLLASFALILLFLLVTLAFGRAWCGWACPQTTLTDLVEWFTGRIGGSVRGGVVKISGWRQGALHAFCAALALLVAANLLWYFFSPYDFFSRLAHGEFPAAAGWALAFIAVPLYLDLALVRRLACREFCPYGRLQATLADAGTLTLRFHPDEAPRCIGCGACARACPMGIDIRRGDQIECINCGRCLDACRRTMAPRGEAGIIRYTFGLPGRGAAALLNGRILLLAGALATAVLLLVLAVVGRSPASLKVGRPAAAPVRLLADGRSLNLYTAVVENRQGKPVLASLTATDRERRPLETLGPVSAMTLAPGERRRIDFSIVLPAGRPAGPIRLHLRDESGKGLAEAGAQLLAPPQSINGRNVP